MDKKKLTAAEKLTKMFEARAKATLTAQESLTAFLMKADKAFIIESAGKIKTLASESKNIGKTLTIVARTKMPKKRGRPAGSVNKKVEKSMAKKPATKKATTKKVAVIKATTPKVNLVGNLPSKGKTKRASKKPTHKMIAQVSSTEPVVQPADPTAAALS